MPRLIFALTLVLAIHSLAFAANFEVVAGKGKPGYGNGGFSGDGGPAKVANISFPKGLACDARGDLYFIDYFNSRIRKIDMGQSPPTISTIAGGGNDPYAEGVPATSVRLLFPEDLAIDDNGNLYMAEPGAKVVLKIDAKTGTISRAAGNYSRWQVGEGKLAIDTSLRNPIGITVDGEGILYIADEHAHRIDKVDKTTGIITAVAGNGSPYGPYRDGVKALDVTVNMPRSVAVDRAGNLYLIDVAGKRVRVRVVDKAGIIKTVAYIPRDAYNVFAGSDGTVFVTGGNDLLRLDAQSKKFVSATGGAVKMSGPRGITEGKDGTIYVSDTGNNRIIAVKYK